MSTMDKATVRKLLREVKQVASHASMTGSLRKGSRVLVDVYNRCVQALKEQGDPLVGELFPTLNGDTAHIDEVGAAAALLYGYMAPEDARRSRHDEDDDLDGDIE